MPAKDKAKRRKTKLKYVEKNRERVLFWSAKNSAKKKGLPFDLEETDIVIPDVCPILNVPIDKRVGQGRTLRYGPEVDRIIPEKGYVKGNVRVISRLANRMKSDATFEEVKRFAASFCPA